MSTFNVALLGLIHFLSALALGSKCPPDAISKLVVCYYEGRTSLTEFDLCNCTHVVFTDAIVTRSQINAINITEDAVKDLNLIKERKENLSAIFTLTADGDAASRILKSENRSEELVKAISEFLQESGFDGVEIDFRFRSDDGASKESFTSFIKSLSKTLSSHHRRIKREGYYVSEKLDDITTAAYTTQTPKNSTTKTQSIKQTTTANRKYPNRKIREETQDDQDDKDYLTLEETPGPPDFIPSQKQNTLNDLEQEDPHENKFLLFVRLPLKPEIIAKKYDLKALSRYADILVVPTHDITGAGEQHLTYHPSRLMGLADILNTDSILDLLSGLGGVKSKMVISLPATVLKFELKDETENTPRAPSASEPQLIDQSELCALFNSKGNWTVERDEDLTAPYAFSGRTWLAFEDEISVSIKGKYILLRELAGGAIYPIDADVSDGSCANRTGSGGHLTGTLRKNFEKLERKPRGLVLERLQEEIHDTGFESFEAGVKLSEYRIVRVVDHTGAVHVIRKNAKTQFECSRQGYFAHPLGCNKFYRCVKFDQYSDEFTVFEYDCPAGLAFDERWEVCVWPGSLPHGAPCTGSSEIAPVPRSHYRCPNQQGYYPDPENCRWFFACLDHARDGVTPLTAYEFRCPFGLVFNAEKLACDWPWMVGSCGGVGVHSATLHINGGNLEASLGQYGEREGGESLFSFGSRLGSALRGAEYEGRGSEGAQSAGFGYIAQAYDDNHNRGSFGSLPEYELSGGRILNKGGVVLEENFGGVSGKSSGYSSGVVSGFGSGSDLRIELEQSRGIFRNGLKVNGHSVGEIRQQNPKPFSVSIPSVQINSEFSGQSTAGVTTPHSVLFTSSSPGVSQQQFSTSEGFTAPSSVLSTTHLKLGPVSSTSKPESHILSLSPVAVSTGAGIAAGAESFGYSGSVTTPVPLPAVTSGSRAFDYSFGAQSTAFYKPVTPTTPTPFAETGHVIGQQTGTGKSTISVGIPAVQTHTFGSSGQSSVSGTAAGASLATLTPPVYSSGVESGVGAGVSFPVVSSRPTLTSFHHSSSIDEKVSNELYSNTSPSFTVSSLAPKTQLFSKTFSSKVPVVTPKTDFRFSQTGRTTFGADNKSKAPALYGLPSVTSQPQPKFQAVTPVVPITFSGLATAKEFSEVSYEVPVTPRNEVNVFQTSRQEGKTSYSVPVVTSRESTDGIGGFVQSKLLPAVQQNSFGERYSFRYSGNNFQKSSQQTEVSLEQQPIVSVGHDSSSVTTSQTLSTPRPFQQQVNRVSFGTNYNHQATVSTPFPVVSITPSTSITFDPPPHSLNVFAKPVKTVTFQQQQPESIRIETSGQLLRETLPPKVTSEEKSSNLQQEFKTFTPVAAVTTTAPQTYQKEFTGIGSKSDFFKSTAYFPPVTPKVDLFGPTVQVPTPKLLQFENAGQERNHPVVHESFEIFGNKPSVGEKRVEFAAVVPEYRQEAKIEGPVVSTGKPLIPQEKLVGLEITKSVELTPSEFFQSSGGYTSGKSIEIQQQPLHLLSQKTFPPKQVIQPFYKQQQTETPRNQYQQQFAFQQEVNLKTPKTDFVQPNLSPAVTSKPYLSPVSYSTAKTIDIQQSVLYSGQTDSVVPSLPVFEPTKAPAEVPGSVNTNRQLFSPKPNLLLPTTTAIPEFVSPQTNEIFLHNSIQKTNNQNISPEVQNVFPQHLKPVFSVFDTSADLFQSQRPQTTAIGSSIVDSEVKYPINPNIAIPEPPKEYILAQNGFTTAVPEYSTARTTPAATASRGSGFQSSTYLPPTSRRKPSKATLVSIGSLDEDIRDDNAQQLVDKYSGRFGQVIGSRNGKVVTQLLKGNGKGEIDFNGQGSSTVQYEVSTRRPASRGRQYHGGITSGIQATNKYEEYEIDGQRSLDGNAEEEDSKTTLDLKNLKLDKNKKTVIVVSQVSDANPILVGKLAGQCSCQSNMLEIRSKGKKSEGSRRKNKESRPGISNKYLPPFETNEAAGSVRQSEATTASPDTVIIDGSRSQTFGVAHTTEQNYVSSSTTVHPELSSTILSSLGPDGVLSITPKTLYADEKIRFRKKQFRGRTRYLRPPSDDGVLASAVPAAEIASTFDYSVLRGDESRSQNEIEGGRGASFDRYGPGGWRGADEVLQGSVDCKRPGLFRHPKYCNKFYACNYDPWKEQYTLHVFNCPIHLTYDKSISACNWPVRGPACADDNLLV